MPGLRALTFASGRIAFPAMSVNPAIFPTALLAGLTFWAGLAAGRRAGSRRARGWLLALGALLALPGALLDVHYLHVLDRAAWYYSLRAVPWIEVSAGLAGFLGGVIWRLPASVRGRRLRFAGPLCLAVMTLALLVPYAKQLLTPLAWPDAPAGWRDGICRQSTPATCGPASAATLSKSLGVVADERELARESFTTSTGTECWYLARALRRRGLRVEFLVVDPRTGAIPCPAIAGEGAGGAGHFVALLERLPAGYVVADPLGGRMVVPEERLRRFGTLTGFFMTLSLR